MAGIALVGPEEEENLSLRYLAASLQAAGFETVLVPFDSADDIGAVLSTILDHGAPPALVGLSLSFQWRALDFLSLAVELRERGYRGHITAGGHFATFACRELLADFPELDSICRHEAEPTLVALAGAVVTGAPLDGIAGLATREPDSATCHGRASGTRPRHEALPAGAALDREGLPATLTSAPPAAAPRVRLGPLPTPPDLAALPWPDRRGEPVICLGHAMAPLVASRGCYADCAFCCIAAWHAQASPGRRQRLRPAGDVADEMAWLHTRRGIDLFVFHDDNFFVPDHAANLARLEALADALAARNVTRFGTIVKARPPDVTPEIARALRDRLGCIRVFLGIESDSAQGLRTLRRGVRSPQNHEALRLLREHGLYTCFNLLIFDPDTTLESLAVNLAFMERHAEHPLNFGRAELYAGTPLLERMRSEGRCTGDYLGHDYTLATPALERIFRLTLRCFHERNFAPGAPANRLQATRFDVEVCRRFHQDVYRPEWLAEARHLSRRLALDSVAGLRDIVAFVRSHDGPAGDRDAAFVRDLAQRLRRTEHEVSAAALDLEERVQAAAGARCRHGRRLSGEG